MKVFDFDPHELRQQYEEQGWLHIRSGLTSEFLEYAREHVAQASSAEALAGAAIRGAKTQFVFEFPDDVDLQEHVREVIATLSGMDPSRTVVSERHIKAYLPDADPAPQAHKDRYASQVSVGLTLQVGDDSHVVLWPSDEREVNQHLTAGLRDSLRPDETPEVRLTDETAVMLHDAPGDVLVFPGSSTWHLRRNSASTTLVYLKFNDFGSDPLSEDPTSGARRAATGRTLAAGDEAVDRAVAELSRGFDSVAREHGREDGRALWSVNVWQDGERQNRSVPEAWASVLDTVGGGRSVGELADEGVAGLRGDDLRAAVRGLAERGALDLV